MQVDQLVPDFSSNTLQESAFLAEFQKVAIPPHRQTPLKNNWMKIYTPIVEQLDLLIRFNTRSKCVELKSQPNTAPSHMQKALDYLHAFCLGFEIDDCLALVRMDDLFVETFEVKDVKMLSGDHLSRAIGRIAGKDGKTKFAIENTTRTRVVLADSKIHILGSFQNIRLARDALCNLILGSPPGKVYSQLRSVSSRMRERF